MEREHLPPLYQAVELLLMNNSNKRLIAREAAWHSRAKKNQKCNPDPGIKNIQVMNSMPTLPNPAKSSALSLGQNQ